MDIIDFVDIVTHWLAPSITRKLHNLLLGYNYLCDFVLHFP